MTSVVFLGSTFLYFRDCGDGTMLLLKVLTYHLVHLLSSYYNVLKDFWCFFSFIKPKIVTNRESEWTCSKRIRTRTRIRGTGLGIPAIESIDNSKEERWFYVYFKFIRDIFLSLSLLPSTKHCLVANRLHSIIFHVLKIVSTYA